LSRMKTLVALLVSGAVLVVGVGAALAINANVVKQAGIAVKAAEKGTSKLPSSASRPAAKGKHIFIIDAGKQSESSLVPDEGAAEAAKALGWQVTVEDGKLTTATYSGLVSDAVAQGADGIIMDAIDCKYAENPLKQAKAKHIVVVPIYAFDCNDPVGGNGGPALFTTCTNYNNIPCAKLANFTRSYGQDQANYVINDTKGKGTVLVINDPEYTVLKYTAQGFENQLKAAGQKYVVFNFKIADLLTGKLQGDVTSELLKLKNQGIKPVWVKSPFSAATFAGISQAVLSTSNGSKIMGGEGFADELKTKGVTATNVISSTWSGWGAVDAMNSVFDKKKTVPSGIGWTIVKGNHAPQFPNFKATYKKAWGVGR
jgi:ribose transport system substrate-binding protein